MPSEPTEEQVNAAVKVVKKLKLKNYDVEQFENPALQAHFRMIESLALFKTDEEEICDTTMPGIYQNDTHEKKCQIATIFMKNLLFRSSTVKIDLRKISICKFTDINFLLPRLFLDLFHKKNS